MINELESWLECKRQDRPFKYCASFELFDVLAYQQPPSSSAPPSAQMRSSAEPVNVVRCINPLYGRERTNISRLALRLLRPADNTNYLHVRKHNIIIYAAGRFIQAHFYSRRSRVAEEESPQKNATE
ncbi:hypothetical protein V9T40_008099 [Parthenolecanium corni]|uniref:Uncharacterized protein n=1 Tax=Parthenolecanium corni TaxID=536013 RepID=A0AAN9Y9K2_9HEMI